MSLDKQRELEAWYKQRAAEDNFKALLAIMGILEQVDKTVYAKQYGKEIPQKLFIQYFNAKNKIADAERDIKYYQKLLQHSRPAEIDGINRKIEQNQAYIDAWNDRITEGFKGWFETYGYPFLVEIMPKLELRKDRVTVGAQSKGGIKELMELAQKEAAKQTESKVEETSEEQDEEQER